MTEDYSKYFKTPSIKTARKRKTTHTPKVDYNATPNLRSLGRGKHYLIQTYGCQGNEADTETMKGILEELSFEETTDETQADLIILNTCAIRENAENRVFGELGRLKKQKNNNPDVLLGVAGCMPQEESVTNRILEKFHYVDLVFGTHNIHRLPQYLETAIHSKERVIEVFSQEGEIVENLPKKREHPTKAYVNIMFGCDEFCTYCIVPYTRGKERSRDPQDIIEEVQTLIDEGYQEVTLLGQNVNAYGRDFKDKAYTFADLLHALGELNIPRVRFTTSHPNDFDDRAIEALATHANMMPHIHLPVQSGSNKVLKKMNRKYTKESYLDLVARIRQAIPDASVTTDIIVGFPGEDEVAFMETIDLIKQVDFEGAFTFVFSARKGTPAENFEDTTPMEEKKQRLKYLNTFINEGYLKGNERFKDEVVDVLVDGRSKKHDSILAGYTPHNKLVNFPGDPSLIGRRISVKVTEAKTWFLKGTIYESTR